MGGAGVAAPALIWSLMRPETFFFLGGMRVPCFLVRGPTPWAMTRLQYDARAAWPGRAVRRQILATWLNANSTGVSRPKMETSTLSFWFSTLISEIVAGSVSNGPSVTVTDSPTSKSTSTGAFDDAAAAAAGLPA